MCGRTHNVGYVRRNNSAYLLTHNCAVYNCLMIERKYKNMCLYIYIYIKTECHIDSIGARARELPYIDAHTYTHTKYTHIQTHARVRSGLRICSVDSHTDIIVCPALDYFLPKLGDERDIAEYKHYIFTKN